jgi:hypothetical protein
VATMRRDYYITILSLIVVVIIVLGVAVLVALPGFIPRLLRLLKVKPTPKLLQQVCVCFIFGVSICRMDFHFPQRSSNAKSSAGQIPGNTSSSSPSSSSSTSSSLSSSLSLSSSSLSSSSLLSLHHYHHYHHAIILFTW